MTVVLTRAWREECTARKRLFALGRCVENGGVHAGEVSACTPLSRSSPPPQSGGFRDNSKINSFCPTSILMLDPLQSAHALTDFADTTPLRGGHCQWQCEATEKRLVTVALLARRHDPSHGDNSAPSRRAWLSRPHEQPTSLRDGDATIGQRDNVDESAAR